MVFVNGTKKKPQTELFYEWIPEKNSTYYVLFIQAKNSAGTNNSTDLYITTEIGAPGRVDIKHNDNNLEWKTKNIDENSNFYELQIGSYLLYSSEMNCSSLCSFADSSKNISIRAANVEGWNFNEKLNSGHKCFQTNYQIAQLVTNITNIIHWGPTETHVLTCDHPHKYVPIIIIILLLSFVAIGVSIYYGKKKYSKMKNINVILPSGDLLRDLNMTPDTEGINEIDEIEMVYFIIYFTYIKYIIG